MGFTRTCSCVLMANQSWTSLGIASIRGPWAGTAGNRIWHTVQVQRRYLHNNVITTHARPQYVQIHSPACHVVCEIGSLQIRSGACTILSAWSARRKQPHRQKINHTGHRSISQAIYTGDLYIPFRDGRQLGFVVPSQDTTNGHLCLPKFAGLGGKRILSTGLKPLGQEFPRTFEIVLMQYAVDTKRSSPRLCPISWWLV